MNNAKPVLVTGATGYIGGRLVPQLLERGYRVRCMVRDRNRLKGRRWEGAVEIVEGDVLDKPSLVRSLEGCGIAYYLVHSMASSAGSFREQDHDAAENFASAAAEAGVERIIYLGGLGNRAERLSAHLASRHEVGDVLRAGSVPTTELRAAMIIGSGSASFEMLRSLVSRLPVMICPKWVSSRTQPIAIRSVLAYLIGCLENPATAGQVFDIGGPDVLSYKEMMQRFAAIMGLKRRMIVVPVLTPRLSAYWANLVTPVPASIAFPLIEGLKADTICEDDRIHEFVQVEPISFEDAVRMAMEKHRQHSVETRWTNASIGVQAGPRTGFDPESFPIRDVQRVSTTIATDRLFAAVARIGGNVGWYYADWLWVVRGWMDRLIGGVGLRRGRRDPEHVLIGDALDFWRVEDMIPDRRLLLHAEMKVPGDAWLEFRVEPSESGQGSQLIQTAFFRPMPFWGRAYWNLLYPLHYLIFRGMAHKIVEAAESMSTE
ncbi:MAG: SDR family oxidoreductase [Isosphaeraceae bacterium]|nr:SDR family oxidoreductase [Isosphaeraceae bacterium]